MDEGLWRAILPVHLAALVAQRYRSTVSIRHCKGCSWFGATIFNPSSGTHQKKRDYQSQWRRPSEVTHPGFPGQKKVPQWTKDRTETWKACGCTGYFAMKQSGQPSSTSRAPGTCFS
ncbi:hypothetical protein V5799_022257 [Amblyomma americanum]|uniref:Uncharacterized protein n=1 Tax=Amblyomma americanum TaxID=6943 RepID=A0AAQ4FL00_AMBAM